MKKLSLVKVLNEISSKRKERTGALEFRDEEIQNAIKKLFKTSKQKIEENIFSLPIRIVSSFTNPHSGVKENLTIILDEKPDGDTLGGFHPSGKRVGVLNIFIDSEEFKKRINDPIYQYNILEKFKTILRHEIVHAFDPEVYGLNKKGKSATDIYQKYGYSDNRIEIRAFIQEIYFEIKEKLSKKIKDIKEEIYLTTSQNEHYETYNPYLPQDILDLFKYKKNPLNLFELSNRFSQINAEIRNEKTKKKFYELVFNLAQQIPEDIFDYYRKIEPFGHIQSHEKWEKNRKARIFGKQFRRR